MSLSKHLVLARYMLRAFGFDSLEELRDKARDSQTGYTATGHSYIAGLVLAQGSRTVTDDAVLRYDEAIKEMEEGLRTARAEAHLTFKYYQYFSLLFTEHFLDRWSTGAEQFAADINAWKSGERELSDMPDYTPADLKKLAFWMATGSGKTLVMHCNYKQLLRYAPEWENIILITPNEGLSQQHYEEMRLSGIPARLYTGSEESLKPRAAGEVLILEITKLTRDKEGEGVSIDVDYFSESRNLVFIDEGHKGQKSEEKTWKGLRSHLTRGEGSFTVEYSATFGQIIGARDKDLLHEYGRAIIFDYSYRYFYEDGYGKDFSVFNISPGAGREEYSEREVQLLLTASLLGFYEQLVLYREHEAALKEYQVEKPLWVFIGSKVVGRKNGKTDEAKAKKLTGDERSVVSDVSLVLQFFQSVLASPAALQADMDSILDETSGLLHEGEDIFKKRFRHLRTARPTAAAVLEEVFGGAGELAAQPIRTAEGEIGLKTAAGEYFGVVNIGDVSSFLKKLEEDTSGSIPLTDDHFTPSLFGALGQRASRINILIGSKKFIEGWNSWRVSSMGLMNMGKNEGAQIIQLFGRGVRLKGRGFSLKREPHTASYFVQALQTISIFGLNADYMQRFLATVDKEVEKMIERELPIEFNNAPAWDNKVWTLRTNPAYHFSDRVVMLQAREGILKRIAIDLRTQVNMAAGTAVNAVAEHDDLYQPVRNPLHEFRLFINMDRMMLVAAQHKAAHSYTNLVVTPAAIEKILASTHYKLRVTTGQLDIEAAMNGRLQRVAEWLLKDYMNRFYADAEKDFFSQHLELETLSTESHPQVFPDGRKWLVKVPESKAAELEALIEDINSFYTRDVTEIGALHFNTHLYSPLIAYAQGKEKVKSIPTKLNKGETDFIRHLRDYMRMRPQKFAGKELFVLRNLSRRGVGFFIESSSFYPDFIVWLVEGEKQTIYFVDPKGILLLGNFSADKIQFCTQVLPEISEAVRAKQEAAGDEREIVLKAFILSVTPYEEVKASWENSEATLQDFRNNNVLFLNPSMDYLEQMFSDV